MTDKQKHALVLRNTDLDGALKRFDGDEQLYISCLKLFLDDSSMEQLDKYIESRNWEDALTAANALKGLAGNMGFVPLMQSTGKLIIMMRGGRTLELGEYISKVKSNYRDIVDAVRGNFIKK